MTTESQSAFSNLSKDEISLFSRFTRNIYPGTMEDVMAWATEFWLHHGTYQRAISKAVRYFMTDVRILPDTDSDNVSMPFEKKLRDKFDYIGDAATIGDDYIGWGNSFITLHMPFTRMLSCPKCKQVTIPVKEVHATLNLDGEGNFLGKCPRCNSSVKFIVNDKRIPDSACKPKIVRWPPQYMRMKYHPISGRKVFYIRSSDYKELADPIKEKDLLFLEDTPKVFIEAIMKGEDIEFFPDTIYHMCNETPAYFLPKFKGWGLPSFMSSFETAIMVTLIDRYNEAILIDYLVPFRLLSPPAAMRNNAMSDGSMDIMMASNMGDFKRQLQDMLERHRKNPTGWNFFPFPVEQQLLGGEGQNILPIEIHKFYIGKLLSDMDIPPEFYATDMKNTGAPIISFKMFERSWQHFSASNNRMLSWATAQYSKMTKGETVKVELIPVSITEDPQVADFKMQMASAGKLSMGTLFQNYGLNYASERARVFDEQDEEARLMEDRQKEQEEQGIVTQTVMTSPEQQAQAQAGQPMPPGQSSAMSANPTGQGATVDDILYQSQQIAQEYITKDYPTRRKMLADLKHTKPELYAMVKQELENLEQQAAQMGVVAARQGQIQVPPTPPPAGSQ